MPYTIRKRKCKQTDGDSGSYVLSYTTKKGKKVNNCHTSKKKAQGQIAAIEGPPLSSGDTPEGKEIMNETLLYNLIKEVLLQERVFGAQAFVYHGSNSRPDVWIPAITRNEFKPGGGDMYGKGLYTVYDLDKTQTSEGGYGEYVYKLKVNLYGFVIFDEDVAMKVYGQALTPRQQILKLGLDELAEFVPDKFTRGKFTSDDALDASDTIKGLVKGLVFTGRRDGRVAVIYDPSTVVPVAWRETASKNPNEWHGVSREEMRPALRRSATAAGEFETERFEIDPIAMLKKLEKLPLDKRIVGGDLDFSYTRITSLPAGLKVGGDLYLYGTRITSLPAGLKVGGFLNLAGTRITSLPDDLEVGGSLRLDYTPITSLPAGLKVGGGLNLSDTPITSLPAGLKVGGDLYLSYTLITSLPDDLEVGGEISGFSGNKNSVPAHLRSKIPF